MLVGIDLDVKPGRHTVTIDAGPAAAPTARRTCSIVLAKTFRTRTLKVDEAFVNPPASAQKRIAEETAGNLHAAGARPRPQRLWTTPFARPVPQQANSAFGTRSIFNGQPRSAHSGADFLSPTGTPVAAPGAGRVVLAKDLYFSGNTVIIDHGAGVFSMLAHLSQIDAKAGAAVQGGEIVGRVGATGRVTGPHLHWTVRVNGARVDPLALLELLGKKYIAWFRGSGVPGFRGGSGVRVPEGSRDLMASITIPENPGTRNPEPRNPTLDLPHQRCDGVLITKPEECR